MKAGSTIPVLRIFDEQMAKTFYIDHLGFAVVIEHRFDEAAPLYMGVSRDGCILHLTEHYGDCSPGASVRTGVDGLDELYHELQAREHSHSRPAIEETPWGSRDMMVTDPFGNRLTFTATMESST